MAHIAQLSAASLLSGTLEPLWPLASVMPTPAPGVDCPLQAGGHETRGRAQPQHTGSRGPEDGWRGRGHSAVWPASGPWSNMSPDPPQRRPVCHCLMVKHLFAGRILARPRVCCDRMKARAEVNISMPRARVGPLQTADCCCCSRAVMILLAERGERWRGGEVADQAADVTFLSHSQL